jgi:cytochrome c oxidase subunit 2
MFRRGTSPTGRWVATIAACLVVGCTAEVRQSAVHPAGPAAAEIAWLWWIMCGAFTAVFMLVLTLVWMALLRRAPSGTAETTSREGVAPPFGRNGFVIAGGIILPVVVLVPLLILSLESSAELKQPQEALTIRVVGKMWWWEVSYPEQGIVTANEIHIPAGEKVRLELESTDVVHSLWVPNLNGKRDLIPGITNEFWLQADEPGVYRGQCAEYCGLQHANMVLYVVAHPPDEFREWMEQRQPASSVPVDPVLSRGQQVFQSAGCATCHAVRGTAAAGKAGPDLTHFGSRRTIAGIVPNNRGNLAGWIADPHAIKPGIKMPRTYLHADDLLVLTSYLESLK